MGQTRTNYKSGVAATIFTNIAKLIKGNTVRDKLNLLADSAVFPEDLTKEIGFACSDEFSDLTTGQKISFPMPFGMTLLQVRASLVTAQPSGTIFTMDVKMNGVSVFSTLLTIDNGETTSVLASTPAVISNPNLTDNSVITAEITQIGTSGAQGLKIWLIGQKV